jgi:hypothetical protein
VSPPPVNQCISPHGSTYDVSLQFKVDLMLMTGCTDSDARLMLARYEGNVT